MSETLKNVNPLCPNCGDADNESEAIFCQTCGAKLGSHLIVPPTLPNHSPEDKLIGGRFKIHALLWTAPTYSAYSATAIDDPKSSFTLLEQSVGPYDPFLRLSPLAEISGQSLAGGIDGADTLIKRFGIFKPVEHVVESDVRYIVFEEILGQAIAHLEQVSEKEARAIGLQLCDLAERFHRQGWVYNGFEPYEVVLDLENRVHLIGFDRTRKIGMPVADAPIYPSRGFTAPELFEKRTIYDPAMDVYAIGALLQFMLTGESIGPGEDLNLYPVATVIPNFERLLSRALAEDPHERFQRVADLREALLNLNLPVVLQSGHFTDVGLVRELNEDSVLAFNLTQYFESVQTQIGLYIVSDGMGGEAAGEVASRVTVRAVAEYMTEKLISASLKSTREERIAAPTQTGGLRLAVADGYEMATTEMLKEAVMHANREVLAYAKSHPEARGLGATVTVALVAGDVLTIAHVGDSRCYKLSGEHLKQLSEDHSLVQRMINTGNLSRAEARIHPYRNVIYRSIGADEEIEIDIIRHKLTSGDVLTLCSDGLNGMLSDDQIRDILIVNPDPNAAAKELVVAANAAGGEDNTSVIVVRVN